MCGFEVTIGLSCSNACGETCGIWQHVLPIPIVITRMEQWYWTISFLGRSTMTSWSWEIPYPHYKLCFVPLYGSISKKFRGWTHCVRVIWCLANNRFARQRFGGFRISILETGWMQRWIGIGTLCSLLSTGFISFVFDWNFILVS
jgi:hypothetical protein